MSMCEFDLEIDMDIDAAVKGISDNAEEALEDMLDFIGEETDKVIPLEEGILKDTKDIDVKEIAGELQGAIGYDTEYAIKQHEDQTLSHDSGRKAKYLEDTVKKYQKVLGEIWAKKFKGMF